MSKPIITDTLENKVRSLERPGPPVGNQHLPGDLQVDSNIRIGPQTTGIIRRYGGGYAGTIVAGTIYKIGEFSFTASSENFTITGEIRGQNTSLGGHTTFRIACRTNTFPAKAFEFVQYQDQAFSQKINIHLYHDATSGRVVLGFEPLSTNIQDVGWSLEVLERGNYNYWQNELNQTVLVTTGLTEITALPEKPMASVTKSANQSIANNAATYALVTWDVETFDNASMHDNVTNNSRLLLPKVGTWEVGYFFTMSANAAGARETRLMFNSAGDGTLNTGTELIRSSGPDNVGSWWPTVHLPIQTTTTTSYIELFLWQNSGVALNLLAIPAPKMWAIYQGPL
jgi:hypothetical protein